MVDFEKQYQQANNEEDGEEEENAYENSASEASSQSDSESTETKYEINGQMLTLAKITKIANKKPSKKTIRITKERAKLSRSLIALLLSKECQVRETNIKVPSFLILILFF